MNTNDDGQREALANTAADAAYERRYIPHKHNYDHGTLSADQKARILDLLGGEASEDVKSVHTERYGAGDYRLFNDDDPADSHALIIDLTEGWAAQWGGHPLSIADDGIEAHETPTAIDGRYAVKYVNHHAQSRRRVLLVLTLR